MARFGAGLALCAVVAASVPATSSQAIPFEGEGEAPKAACPEYHNVRSGENLWDIARQHYGTVAVRSNDGRMILHYPTEIAAENGFSPDDLIHPGQRLVLPDRYGASCPEYDSRGHSILF